MEYMSAMEAAEKWEITVRRVQQYCVKGRIEGAEKLGRSWMIPENAPKPDDPRRKKGGKNKRIGAVIVAAGKYGDDEVSPFSELGETSLIRRLVLIFQQAFISDIVVITGYRSYELEHHLSDYGVVFLKNEHYESTDKMSSVKIGLEYLEDKCDKIFFTSIKVPMFTADTLKKMYAENHVITTPAFQGRVGHPILIDSSVVPILTEYSGNEGMRGAIRASGLKRSLVEVDNAGILMSAENTDLLQAMLDAHNEHLLHPYVRMSIEKEGRFFDARGRLLLELIQDFHSVSRACQQMALSQKKAWEIIHKVERELGFTVVERHRGGPRERKTQLTERGLKFLQFYKELEREVDRYARKRFESGWAEMMGKCF